MKKKLLFCGGWFSLLLGVVGIPLPVLPTTPFIILAAWCFSLSSEKMHRFLCRSAFFGPYIENYRTKQGISVWHKVKALLFLWLFLGIAGWHTQRLWLRLFFVAVGCAVTVHLLMIKTKKHLEGCCAAREESVK